MNKNYNSKHKMKHLFKLRCMGLTFYQMLTSNDPSYYLSADLFKTMNLPNIEELKFYSFLFEYVFSKY